MGILCDMSVRNKCLKPIFEYDSNFFSITLFDFRRTFTFVQTLLFSTLQSDISLIYFIITFSRAIKQFNDYINFS